MSLEPDVTDLYTKLYCTMIDIGGEEDLCID